jgi:hypothetical protein
MSTLTETLNPAEFVQSYTLQKYRREIEAWGKAATPGDLINVLRIIGAPKATYVEISIALAEEVLPVFEKECPQDPRPRQAVEAAKAWLVGGTQANVEASAKSAEGAFNAVWNINALMAGEARYAGRVAYCAAYAAAYPVSNADQAAVTFAIAYAVTTSVGYASYTAACADQSAQAAYSAAYYAVEAGFSNRLAVDIVRRVGCRYFAFLRKTK